MLPTGFLPSPPLSTHAKFFIPFQTFTSFNFNLLHFISALPSSHRASGGKKGVFYTERHNTRDMKDPKKKPIPIY